MPALLGHPLILGCCEGPWCSSDFVSAEWRTKAGRSRKAPIGHLRACCLSWPTPGVVSSNFDDADCNAGRQGGVAGLRKVAGAFNLESFACARDSDRMQLPLRGFPAI
eukprot:1137322-Pelagomonas_calceolata.AAC.1